MINKLTKPIICEIANHFGIKLDFILSGTYYVIIYRRGVALLKTDGDFFTEIFNINVSKIAVCYMNIY